MINVNEFLNFNDEKIVYEVLSEDQIIKKLDYVFKNNKSTEVIDEKNAELIDKKDDSIKIAI
ncbi:6980_t:CDS:1, partial [Cetraspora pellucida]